MSKANRVGIIGDSHCPVMLDGYAEWCMSIFEQWQVNRIIHIGDLADHHSASFHDSEIGFTDIVGEMEAARDQIQHMQKVFGKNVEVLTGDHDANLARKMKAVGLDPSLLRKQAEIWGIEWKFYPRYHKLQIDDYQIFHGDQGRGGKTPAIAKAEADWTSSAIGHHHTAGGVTWGCNNNSRYWGMSVGCGIDHKHAVMAYGASFAQKPIISCGVVIDGVPYFEPMPKKNKFGRRLR